MSLLFISPLDHIGVYANKVIHMEPLNSFRIGAGHAGKTNCVITGLGIWTMWYRFYLGGGGEATDEIQSHGQ